MPTNSSREDRSRILNIILREMNVSQHVRNLKGNKPFTTLIKAILSQNTTFSNASTAFKNLSATYKITPESLMRADVNKIQDAIHVAGLQRKKSQRIKEIASYIYSKWKSDLDFIRRGTMSEVRKKLTSLSGIGKKTADMLLNICGNRPILPIDTHITRIARRLGFVSDEANYDDIRRAFEKLTYGDKILHVHFALIFLGQKICKTSKPLCLTCPVTDLCPKISVEN